VAALKPFLTTAFVAALGLTSAAAGAERPVLRVVEVEPIVLQGIHFKPGEQVTLHVWGPARVAKKVKAGLQGGFRVRLRLREQCDPLVVHAFGSKGSRARLLRRADVICPPTR
jgi:hypothetical protein